MYLILLKIFVHDLVISLSLLSIKSAVGAKTRGKVKNWSVRYSDGDWLVNWFVQSRCHFNSDKCKVGARNASHSYNRGVVLQKMMLFKMFRDHSRTRISGCSSSFLYQKPVIPSLAYGSSWNKKILFYSTQEIDINILPIVLESAISKEYYKIGK